MNRKTRRLLGRKTFKSASLLLIFMVGLLSIVATGGNGDDEPGSLQLGSNAYNATEGTDATVTISVTRTSGSKGAVSVDYATSDDSATQPSDYTLTSGSLSWGDGDTATKTFAVPIIDNTATESTETFNITLSNVQTATLGSPSTAAVSITDDDVAGILQLSSATYSVTEGTDSSVTVNVTRTGGSGGAVSVDIATSDDTAKSPGDYTANSDTLSWVDGDTADKSFVVTIIDDSDVELIEAFNVILNNEVNATLGPISSAVVTINNDDLIPVNGRVLAPSGALAFKQPSVLQRMFAALFGYPVNAAIGDLVSPVVGVSVSIYEVDAAGNVVGSAIDTSTTDGLGDFSLTAPADALDGIKYIVRASGTTEKLDSRITSATLSVDPSTDAASRLVASLDSNLTEMTPQEVMEMQIDVEELVTYIPTEGADATTLSNRLYDEANSRVGRLNVLRSKSSSGQICGNVQTAGGSPLEGIHMIVRDYSDWTTRARTYTDANGDYCINVPVKDVSNPDGGVFSGDYIIGAINQSNDSVDPDRSASEWLGNGSSHTMLDAIKISVPSTTPVLAVDFSLELGAQITGTIRADNSLAALEGVQVSIRHFDTHRRLVNTRAAQDGTYSINVIPGTYLVVASNTTTAAFASEVYDAAIGTHSRNLGAPVIANVGDQLTIDFTLETGSQISGTINDGAAVINTPVRFTVNGTAEVVNTDRNGEYNVWLRPGIYNVYVYGQRSIDLDLSASSTVDFSGTVSTISAQLQDSLTNPVRNTSVRIYRKPNASTTSLRAYGSSDNLGNFSVYTDQTGDYILEVRSIRESGMGSVIYMNKTQQLIGDLINVVTVGNSQNLGTISLPDGGILKGTVYEQSSISTVLTPIPEFRVQVRDGGTQLDNRFIQVRTRGDGSYQVNLPAGNYDRVKMRDAFEASLGNGNCDNITITTGTTTVLDFYDGNSACVIQ